MKTVTLSFVAFHFTILTQFLLTAPNMQQSEPNQSLSREQDVFPEFLLANSPAEAYDAAIRLMEVERSMTGQTSASPSTSPSDPSKVLCSPAKSLTVPQTGILSSVPISSHSRAQSKSREQPSSVPAHTPMPSTLTEVLPMSSGSRDLPQGSLIAVINAKLCCRSDADVVFRQSQPFFGVPSASRRRC